MEEEMGMHSEENMYCMSFVAESEQSFQEVFDNSALALNQANQRFDVFTGNQVINREEEATIEENVTIQEENSEKNKEEITEIHPLYKLSEMDTEASIRTEVKQLIYAKASDEVCSQILSDTTYDLEDNIESLKTQRDQLVNKIQDLEKVAETDETTLTQSKMMLQETNEMIILLKENVEKLSFYKDANLINLFKRSIQQEKFLESLKETYTSKLKNEKQKFKKVESVEPDFNTDLKLELSRKEEVLSRVKKEQNRLEENLLMCKLEVEKATKKKDFLTQKKLDVTNNKTTFTNELTKQRNIFQDVCVKKQSQSNRFNSINKNRIKFETELLEASRFLNELKSNVTCAEENLIAKTELLKKLKDDFELVKCQHKESFDQLQQTVLNIDIQVNELLSRVRCIDTDNEQLLQKLQVLDNTFLQKNEEKLSQVNEILKRQNLIQELKMDLMKKRVENEAEHKKCLELKNQHEEMTLALHVVKSSITIEKENIECELHKVKTNYYNAQTQCDKARIEIRNKREYMLANAKFLEEKSANLRNEIKEIDNSLKKLQDENIAVKTLVEKKTARFNECKMKLSFCNRDQNPNLKHNVMPCKKENIHKKVQFNDVISFKSATSSENSNIPINTVEKLNTSLHEPLQEGKSSDVEK